MYSALGTHVLAGMTEDQIARARRWERPALVAALLVIPYLLLNHYADSGTWEHVSDGLYLALWLFFVVEVLAMLRVAPSKAQWLSGNILDVTILTLTAPLPFLGEKGEALQALWVLRILDLLPYVHHYIVRVTVLRFAALLWVLAIFAGGIAYAVLEAEHPEGPKNLFDAFYFSSTVISTVGFGDVLPHLWQTKVLCMLLQVTGPVLAAILVAGLLPQFDSEFAEGFSERVEARVEELAGDIEARDIRLAADIDLIEQGERAQDRILAEILRNQQRILEQTRAPDDSP